MAKVRSRVLHFGRLFPLIGLVALASWPAGTLAGETPSVDSLKAGSALHGLRCRIEVPRRARQGESLKIRVSLDYSASAAPGTCLLLNMPASSCCRLEFRDRAGRVHLRDPATSGMPISPGSCGENQSLDLRAPRPADLMYVPLLAPRGGQLEPGEYEVTAVYDNQRLKGYTEEISDAEPTRFWWGAIRSAPVPLRIVRAAPRRITFRVFDEIRRVDLPGQLSRVGWAPAHGPGRVVHAEVRPGYAVGHRVNVYRGEGRDFMSGELSSGPDIMEANGGSFGAADTIRVQVTIFETSELTPHMWSPESGDYRELWSGEFWSYPLKP